MQVAFFFSALCTFYVIAEISLSTRLVLFVRRELGYTIAEANQLLAGFFLGLFLGRLLFAVYHFPVRNQTVLFAATSLSALFYACGLLIHPGWFVLTGLSFSVFYPVAIDLINEEQGKWAGYVISFAITSQALGIMLMHYFLGQLSDLYGLGNALWVGPVALIFVLLCLGVKSRFAPYHPEKKIT